MMMMMMMPSVCTFVNYMKIIDTGSDNMIRYHGYRNVVSSLDLLVMQMWCTQAGGGAANVDEGCHSALLTSSTAHVEVIENPTSRDTVPCNLMSRDLRCYNVWHLTKWRHREPDAVRSSTACLHVTVEPAFTRGPRGIRRWRWRSSCGWISVRFSLWRRSREIGFSMKSLIWWRHHDDVSDVIRS